MDSEAPHLALEQQGNRAEAESPALVHQSEPGPAWQHCIAEANRIKTRPS
jgi:hypothetical protein